MAKFLDLTGERYGRLVVLEYVGRAKSKTSLWRCRCDCGNETTVRASNLRNGHTKSCGCGEIENKLQFGNRSVRKHQESYTRLYRVWLGMKNRCNNRKDDHWPLYGARGISVSDEWVKDYEAFRDWALANSYDDSLTIDRIDPNGNYEPLNCRWVSVADQQRNKRNNRYYTYKGKTQLIPAWAAEFGVTDSTIRSRIRRGANPNDVFSQFERRQANENAKAQSAQVLVLSL